MEAVVASSNLWPSAVRVAVGGVIDLVPMLTVVGVPAGAAVAC